jgi:hypothetical protein
MPTSSKFEVYTVRTPVAISRLNRVELYRFSSAFRSVSHIIGIMLPQKFLPVVSPQTRLVLSINEENFDEIYSPWPFSSISI